jgi:plastocyanin
MMKTVRERGTWKSGERLRRLGLVAGLLVAGLLFAGGVALAASQTIIGQADDTFNQGTYTTDQGEVVPLQVTGSSHNVTAHQNGPDGGALFRTPTISGGTTGVQGTQYLSTGAYTFFCTVHPTTMQATLVVGPGGTPQARPSGTLSVRSKKLAKVSKKGILVAVTASTKVDGASLTAKLGKTTIGKAGGLSLAAGQTFQTVKLSKAGRNKLRGKQKATVSVTADIPFGAPATGKAKLT